MRADQKIGVCGFPLPKQELASRFPIVEVQQTFYQPPKLSTIEKWRTFVPDEFEFSIKAWQLITHESTSPTYRRLTIPLLDNERLTAGSFRPTTIVQEAWNVTRKCAEALQAKRILFQCPASFTPSEEHITHLRQFFQSVHRGSFQFLWEPRGTKWTDDIIQPLTRELDLVHVVDPFVRPTLTPNNIYYRLHGRNGFRYSYSDEELHDLAALLPAESAFSVLFNNTEMLDNAQRLIFQGDNIGFQS